MTREDAIKIFKQLKRIDDTICESPKNTWAVDMAIQALEQEPCREIEDYENEIEGLQNRLDIAEYDKERLREEVTRLEEKIKSLEQEPKWIPVSERLPEKNMECLVCVGKLNFTQIAVYSDLMKTIDHKIFYQGDYGKDNFENITQYVKAWMPLPEPYKAESEVSE